MPDPRQRAVEQLPRARPVAALAVEEPEVVQVEQLFLEGLFLLAAQFFPGLERAIPLTREVVGDAEIVPGDGLLAIVAQGAVELHRARRRPGGALMVSPQPERGAQARESVGLGAAVAPPPRDEHRRAFLGDCAPRFPSVPGASAEQVVQPRRRLLIALLARERQGRLRQLLPAPLVAPPRLRAPPDRGDRERIRSGGLRARERFEDLFEAAFLPARLGDLLPDASGIAAPPERPCILPPGGGRMPGQRETVRSALAEQGRARAREGMPQACPRHLIEPRRLDRGPGTEPLTRCCQGRAHASARARAEEMARTRCGIAREAGGAEVREPPLRTRKPPFRRPQRGQAGKAQPGALRDLQAASDQIITIASEGAAVDLRPEHRRQPQIGPLLRWYFQPGCPRPPRRLPGHAAGEIGAGEEEIELPAPAAPRQQLAVGEIADRTLQLARVARRFTDQPIGEGARPASRADHLHHLGLRLRRREGPQLHALEGGKAK